MRLLPPLLLLALVAAPALAEAVAGVDADAELTAIRTLLDRSLERYRAGDAEGSFVLARDAYLDHFEFLEPPLRVVDADFVSDMETKFADLRGAIKARAPAGEVEGIARDIRRGLDAVREKLEGAGAAIPGLAVTLSFSIIFREGLEAVLLLGIVIGYLEVSKNPRFKKHVWAGAGAALLATLATWLLVQQVISLAPAKREVIEGVTSLLAVAVMFYVTFWILRRIEYRRWIEFIRAKTWAAAATGSILVLGGLAFFAVYREGLETVLFYQALLQLARGFEGSVVLGFLLGSAALAVVALAVFHLGLRVPTRLFFGVVVGIVVFLSIAFLGNGIAELQEVDILPATRLPLPRLSATAAELTGYRPTLETLAAQVLLAAVYAAGALYALVIRPEKERLFAGAKVAERERQEEPKGEKRDNP